MNNPMLLRVITLLLFFPLSGYGLAADVPAADPGSLFNTELEAELQASLEEELVSELEARTALFSSPYDIEIVLFERVESDQQEQWPETAEVPDFSLAVGDLSNPGLEGDGAILLPESQRQLGPAVFSLEQKGARIHAHQAWRQDIQDRDSHTWYRIGNERLNGLVRVSKGRYLHLDTDLMLQSDEPMQSRPSVAADSPLPFGQLFRLDQLLQAEQALESEVPQAAALPHIRIRLHRRMRGGELHYVDHPRVGILIRTLRIEPTLEPEPEVIPEDEIPATPPPVDEPGEERSPTPGSLPRAMPDPT